MKVIELESVLSLQEIVGAIFGGAGKAKNTENRFSEVALPVLWRPLLAPGRISNF